MLDISEACTYVFFALILLKLVSATTIIILIWKGIKVNDIFIRFSKTILDVFSNVFLIPALVQLLLCLKYKLIQKSNVEEYYDNNAYSNFEVHTSVAILVFLMTFLCFIMTLFRSTSSGEIRHSFYQLSLTSRAHSKIEMYNTIYVYTLIVFYVIFGSDNILYFQIISVIFSLWLLIATLKYLPYYWTFYTCVISIRYFVLFFVSALFILGAIFDHSLFIILTSVFIIPIGILFVIAIVFKLESSITLAIPSFVQRFIGAYELEKQLRKTLCSSDLSTKEGLINILADTYLETKLFETTLLAV